MTFEEAVTFTPGLGRGACHSGLRALSATDRGRILCQDTRKLCGSVNVDRMLAGDRRHEHLWDYAICHLQSNQIVYWVEVHPASQHGVTTTLSD